MLGDLISKVLIDVKADTSQARSELQRLGAEEDKLSKSRASATDAGSAGIEKWVAGLGELAAAVGVAKLALSSLNEYAHHLDLESAAAGVNLDRLSKAAHGLKGEQELLTEAARLNHSAFKLSQNQMETAETAMRALEARGNSSAEVWNAFDAALTKGATKPLEQFGIIIDKTGLAVDENGLKLDTFGQKQVALQRIMEGLKKTAKEVEGEQLNAADATQASIIKIGDMFDMAKLKLGELVTKMEPLLASLGHAIDHVTWLANHMPGGGNFFAGGLQGFGDLKDKTGFDALGGSGDVPGWLDSWLPNTLRPNGGGNAGLRRAAGWDQFNSTVRGAMDAVPAVDRFGNSLPASGLDEVAFLNSMNALKGAIDRNTSKGGGSSSFGQFANIVGMSSGTARNDNTGLGSVADTAYRDKYGAEISLQSIINDDKWSKGLAGIGAAGAINAQHQSFLEKSFGRLEEFDAYKMAFGALTGAVTTGLNAWIDGSLSAGQAIRKFLADSMKGLATSMDVEALKHGAYAIGSLAFGDIRGASTHAAAAAAFGAGSIAAAVAAKELGGSASAPAKGSASAGGVSAGGGSGGASGSGNGKQGDRIIVYADAFADDNARTRARRAEALVRRVVGGATGTDG